MQRQADTEETSSACLEAQESFERFYRRHYNMLRVRLRVLTRNNEVAEDLLADTMTLMWSRWMDLDGPGDEAAGFPRLRSYAYTTAHNKVQAYRRSTSQHTVLDPEVELEQLVSHVDASSGIALAETIAQIGRLPEQQQRTLVLKLLGLADREVADELGVGVTTVRSNLAYARKKLADYLAERVRPRSYGGAIPTSSMQWG